MVVVLFAKGWVKVKVGLVDEGQERPMAEPFAVNRVEARVVLFGKAEKD
jgi:hypothetical protein